VRKSEQVIYITLIDFLMQLLFLGLVLWVIFGLSKPDIPQQEIDAIGGPSKATEVLERVKDLLDKYPGNDINSILNDFSFIVDSSGGINQAMEFAKGIKEPQVLFAKLKAIEDAGGFSKVQKILSKMNSLGNGADKIDIEKLLDELVELKQFQPDIDDLGGIAKNIELAKKAKIIIDKTGIDDPDKLAELINKAQRIINASGKSDAPPHIILSETKGFSFPVGSSQLNPDFRKKLENEVVDHVQQAIDKYGINLIEVIGHTDGQPVTRVSKQMDLALESIASEPYVSNGEPKAVQGSNTDLGMLRAVEVVKLLKHLHSLGKLKQINPDTGFRAYSSGQLTMPDGSLSNGQNRKDEPDRRRIEIRLTRLGDRIQEK